FDCAHPAPLNVLRQAGLMIGATVSVKPFCVVEGWVDVRLLPQLATLANVTRIELPHYAAHRQPRSAPRGTVHGPVMPTTPQVLPPSGRRSASPQGAGPTIDGEGVALMQVSQFTQNTSITGAGVKVAIISDDATSVAAIQKLGELPGSVTLVPPSSNPTPHTTPTDEGTMMLEEVHAVAPGAALYFCGPETEVEYLGCLQALIADGVNIVSDDLTFPGDDMMSAQSGLAQGVSSLLLTNPAVSLFTVTGNYNGSYWQGAYDALPMVQASPPLQQVSVTCPTNNQTDAFLESFGGSNGYVTLDVLAVVPGIPLVIQWADAFNNDTSNFDLYFIDQSQGQGVCLPLSSAGGATIYVDTLDDLENQINGTPNAPQNGVPVGNYAIAIATPDASLFGKQIKLLVAGDGATTLSDATAGSITSPQAYVAGVNTIGAVDGSDGVGKTLEFYSGVGPFNLFFPSSTSTQAPLVVAPDGIYVDTTGTHFDDSGNGGLFYGTSAASPNAASVAALLLSAFPTLTPAQLTTALESGATMLGSGTPDPSYGYGRVNAVGSLASIPAPKVSGFTSASIVGGSSSAPLAFTVSGTGNLNVAVTPAGLIAATGVQISPANCGTGATACSVMLTPTLGASGSTLATVSVTDGAKRSASYQASVTVTKPSPPTIGITAGGSQTQNPSATLTPITFAVAGTGPLSVSAASSGGSVMLSPGCGKTVMTCSVSGTAASAVGMDSIVLTVKDSWSQTASATAGVTVSAPAKSGGGSMDPALIAALGLVLTLKLRRARARQIRA
ncbi:MAG TPA: S8 family serine peptidase, partial [Steroidobacteraceae bacterium]|nr:S8 family serine peptidase [Steroidobacteraceae bacterium]